MWGFIYCFFIFMNILLSFFHFTAPLSSLNHDLELRSSSFTFGRARASSALLSLYHDLTTAYDIQSLRGMGHALSGEVVIAVDRRP